jgi:hypothetical protein
MTQIRKKMDECRRRIMEDSGKFIVMVNEWITRKLERSAEYEIRKKKWLMNEKLKMEMVVDCLAIKHYYELNWKRRLIQRSIYRFTYFWRLRKSEKYKKFKFKNKEEPVDTNFKMDAGNDWRRESSELDFLKIIDDEKLDGMLQMAKLMDEYVKLGKLKKCEPYEKFTDVIEVYNDQVGRALQYDRISQSKDPTDHPIKAFQRQLWIKELHGKIIKDGFNLNYWLQLITDIRELYVLRKKFVKWKEKETMEYNQFLQEVTNCKIDNESTFQQYFKFERINTCWKTIKFEYWLKMEELLKLKRRLEAGRISFKNKNYSIFKLFGPKTHYEFKNFQLLQLINAQIGTNYYHGNVKPLFRPVNQTRNYKFYIRPITFPILFLD